MPAIAEEASESDYSKYKLDLQSDADLFSGVSSRIEENDDVHLKINFYQDCGEPCDEIFLLEVEVDETAELSPSQLMAAFTSQSISNHSTRKSN
jgi:hypothetical protein